MIYVLIRWGAHALLLWAVVVVGRAIGLPIAMEGVGPAFIAIFVLAVANAAIRPIMKTFLLPLNCLTFGLLGFLVNILVFWLVSAAVPGFDIGSFLAALYCAVMMSILGGIANRMIRASRED